MTADKKNNSPSKGSVPCVINIVHMGDSITYGQYVAPDIRWTSIVQESLMRKYEDKPVCLSSVNRGVSGETTRIALERFPQDVQNADPDILTLQFGLNDCNCWLTDKGLPRVSPEAFVANLKEMIRRARHFGARHIILANNHPTTRYKKMISGERFEDANTRYSRLVENVAREVDVTFCNIRERFERFSIKELAGMLLPYPDQLHLSEAGNRLYADTIGVYVAQAVEKMANAAKDRNGHEEK